VRERVLVVAVGEHLGRTEMVLMELENAPVQKGQKAINISETQRRAEDLVEENRLYRQTALKEGDQQWPERWMNLNACCWTLRIVLRK